MQEYMQEKTVVLVFHAARFTARGFAKAIRGMGRLTKKELSKKINTGRMSVKRLIQQGKGTTTAELEQDEIRPFHHIARKYGLNYGIRQDKTDSPTKWIVFFHSQNADVMAAALKEYTHEILDRDRRPPIHEKVRKFQAVVKERINTAKTTRTKARNKQKVKSR